MEELVTDITLWRAADTVIIRMLVMGEEGMEGMAVVVVVAVVGDGTLWEIGRWEAMYSLSVVCLRLSASNIVQVPCNSAESVVAVSTHACPRLTSPGLHATRIRITAATGEEHITCHSATAACTTSWSSSCLSRYLPCSPPVLHKLARP